MFVNKLRKIFKHKLYHIKFFDLWIQFLGGTKSSFPYFYFCNLFSQQDRSAKKRNDEDIYVF